MSRPASSEVLLANAEVVDKFSRWVSAPGAPRMHMLPLPPPLPPGAVNAQHASSPIERSYEEYLSSFITQADLTYLPDAATARRVVELG